ncbi:MAG: glycosyltransferase family 2 protein [Deltaproteobacteria bacterium]|nr:glycosyltransferase family 2 protein [Deltaproteobacteria bacterium]
MNMSGGKQHELALAMPVYNEEACIAGVVQGWYNELERLEIDFLLIILNDGSRDETAGRLEEFAGNDRIRIINKTNSGHGPTILMGYRMAVEQASWVFQTDSDDEMKPRSFQELWKRRNDFDALLGYRENRTQGTGRRLISALSRLTVRVFFGPGVVDVNTPYRLIRAPLLADIVRQIPPETFAPNVIISGALAASQARICNVPVPHEGRKTGAVSIVKWKLWKSAFTSFLQTATCRPKVESPIHRAGLPGKE